MARFIILDTGPPGLASRPRGQPDADRCRTWIAALLNAGARVVAPEIADHEVRRELLRVGATAGVRRLDHTIGLLEFDPIATPTMRRAAEFWAMVRRAGLPTADPHALDADCILAAQAALLAGPGDVVMIASNNVRHLVRFPGIAAEEWEKITP